MSVYVGYLDAAPRNIDKAYWPYPTYCHMIADSKAELIQLATLIEVNHLRIKESPRDGFPHFDLNRTKRQRAIEMGAISVCIHEFSEIMCRLRGSLINENKNDQ